EHKQLANAEKIQYALNDCLEALHSSDSNITSQLEHVVLQISQITDYVADANNSLDLINSALININEAVNDLRHLTSDEAIDPQRLQEIETRIGDLLDVARKHNCKPAELQETQTRLESELAPLLNSEESLEQLDKSIQQAKQAYEKLADQLTKKRKTAAKKLETACDDILASLGMKNCQLQVNLEDIDNGSTHGNEKITFLVRTNPGSPFKPLIKVASGGELSRISLAIQVVTAKLNSFPVLVFDEVDVGIGGGTAEVVGKLLRQLSEDKQVLCITHQAQVAAQGHHHWIVEKQATDTDTITSMRALNSKEREAEIARMIGGIKLTAATKKHAKEMLDNAES
ncbi:MAG: DNA repair protein RecN, partial [Gammaproteobacteria bacterium]|nr:DNA repair protein RecN [Gammaproteobacteria bacterium]